VAKLVDLTDLEKYRDDVSRQPESDFQKIALDVIDRALVNLKSE